MGKYSGKLIGETRIFKSNDKRLAIKKATELQVENINALWADGMQVFIKEIANAALKDTGMSVASLLAFAQAVDLGAFKTANMLRVREIGQGEQAVADAISERKRDSAHGYVDIYSDKWQSSPDRSADLGYELGKKAYRITFATSSNPEVNFSFEIVVIQMSILMEDSVRRAAEAFRDYVNTNFYNYCNPLTVLKQVMYI